MAPRADLPVVKFAVTFLGLLVAFQWAYYALIVPSSAFKAYLALSCRAAAAILDVLGEPVTATDDALASGFTMSVKAGCDGLQAMAILALAVLVAPGDIRRKLSAAAAGVALLAILNVVRLVSLFWTGVHAPDLFQAMHVHVWPAALIVVAVLYAFASQTWAGRPESAA